MIEKSGNRRSWRRVRRLSVAAALAALVGAGAAQAAVSGTVLNTAGVPLPDISVSLTELSGGSAGSTSTDANGNYTIATNTRFDIPPYNIKATASDDCDTTGTSSREATVGPAPDGAVGANIVLDVKSFCAGFQDSGGPEPSGIVDPVAARVQAFPGGVVYLNLREIIGFSATDIQVTIADGTAIGGTASSTNVAITAPTADYDGPLVVGFTKDGARISRMIGTLTSRKISVTPLPGPIDIQAIVDVSGSMSGSDPNNIRRDAISLLLDLARPADRVGATGFDNEFRPIFDSTVITGQATVVNQLKAFTRARVGNFGGTNYNAGFDEAFNALTAPGVDPNRQKGIIFLTDGANGGSYENGHLKFAFNPSGRSWPVCAVQLGQPSSFAPADVARLKRIASETGGQYLATQNAGQLTDLYFRCFGRTTGQQTLQTKLFSYTVGQQRLFNQVLRRGNKSATFFLGWSNGNYTLELTDPRGKVHTARRPGRGFIYRGGKTFGFFRVVNPIPGRWRLKVVAMRLAAPRGTARTTITIPPRR